MGHDLYRMLRMGMPADWTPGERLVALIIADACYDRSQTGRISIEQLCEETGYTRNNVSSILLKLSRHGYEMRVEKGTGNDGRPVFATRGHATDFQVPILPPRPKVRPGPALSLVEGPAVAGPSDEKGPAVAGQGPAVAGPIGQKGPAVAGPLPQELTPNTQPSSRAAVVTPSVEDLAPASLGGAPHQPIEIETYEAWIAKRIAANA